MNKQDLLNVVEPVAGFSVLNKYDLPWVWLTSDGNALSTVFSDGGNTVAQCVVAGNHPPFEYKLNGNMLLKALSTLPGDGEVTMERRAGKLVLREGKFKGELPVFPIGSIPGVIPLDTTPDVLADKDTMVRLVKFARMMSSNLCFREGNTAGCYDNHRTYTCPVTRATSDILIPASIVRAIDYMGEEFKLYAVDDKFAIFNTANITVLYGHDKYIDHKLDKRVYSEPKVVIGKIKTPKFSNFKKCGAEYIIWDHNIKTVRQYNIAELMYEEALEGEINDTFVTAIVPELGPELTVYKYEKWGAYLFDFGDAGIFVSAAIRG